MKTTAINKKECSCCGSRDIKWNRQLMTLKISPKFKDCRSNEHHHDTNSMFGNFTCNVCNQITNYSGFSGYCNVCQWPENPDWKKKCPKPYEFKK